MLYCRYHSVDLDNVVILNRDDAQCVINKIGCTITSWRINEVEQLFVSSISKFQKHHAISGGICYCFPKIGPWLTGPASGFAKLWRWEVISKPSIDDDRDVHVWLHLVANAFTRSLWNFSFEIVNHITLKEKSIQIHTTIRNTDALLPLRFNFLYGLYVQTPGLDDMKIRGLNGVTYMERSTGYKSAYIDKKKALFLQNNICRAYINIANRIEIDCKQSESVLRLRHKNLKDLIIWNPGPNDGDVVNYWGKEFNPEQYDEMIFFGFGNALKEIRLLPKAYCEYEVEIERWTGDILCDLLY